MIKASGIHHIAIMAADIKKHIAFFSDVLGCRLSALFDMHGVPGGLHAFMHLGKVVGRLCNLHWFTHFVVH